MVAELWKTNTSLCLYETDYNLWVLETAAKLKSRDLDALDWENLIEEVEDLSRGIKHELQNILRNLFDYLLRLAYWDSERKNNLGNWRGDIAEFRLQIKWELKTSPSLKSYCQEIFAECYQDGRELASIRSQLPLSTFPEQPIATLEQILNEDWLP
jgi:hypothetical protein